MIRSERLARLDGLRHGLTTRDDGSIGPAANATAVEARRAAVRALGADPARLVNGHQVHGAHVAFVGSADAAGGAVPATDGLATDESGTVLMVQGADCPLILLVDPSAPALAVVHSGWRGTVAGIGAVAMEVLRELGARPERVEAALFPGIGSCCFEVGSEVGAALDSHFGARAAEWRRPAPRGGGHEYVDLHAAITATLVDAGVAPTSIDAVHGCTACGGRLWSHRASGGGPERHGLFALLR